MMLSMVATTSSLQASTTGNYFAVARSGMGELYLSHERCPVRWMSGGRARMVQRSGVVWNMCWRADKTNPRVLNVCNISPELARKGEVGACLTASKSMFVRTDSLPRRAF